MERFFLNMLMGVAFVLGSQIETEGEDRQGVRGGDLIQGHRLFYVFSLQDPEHRFRARKLQDLVRSHARLVQVVGIARLAAEDASVEALDDFRRRYEISYPLLDPAAAAGDAKLPSALKTRLGQTGDFALLVDPAGQTAGFGTGREMVQLLSLLLQERVSTDVDESTWGKIKELFQ